jgi:large subunit ribosomal protein L28
MATGNKCYNCGKGIMVGHNVSHAKNRTRKVFKPNLHPAKITVGGTSMRVKLCTKCLREVRGKSTRAIKKASADAKALADKQNSNQKTEGLSTSAPIASGLA